MVGIDKGCLSILALTNRIHREANGLKTNGLPLDAFPQKFQSIIFDVTHIEQFDMEYLAMSMLSAAATAIGNSCQIRIRGSWRSSPALYVILIGRPGQGKTPPLDYAYRPLQEHDFLQVSRFIEAGFQHRRGHVKKLHRRRRQSRHRRGNSRGAKVAWAA